MLAVSATHTVQPWTVRSPPWKSRHEDRISWRHSHLASWRHDELLLSAHVWTLWREASLSSVHRRGLYGGRPARVSSRPFLLSLV